MTIKKYQAGTETEAIMLAKEELGKDAIVMSIKTIKPKGIFCIFRKVVVEVTAAVDENKRAVKAAEPVIDLSSRISPNKDSMEKEKKPSAIEEKINSLTELLEKQVATAMDERKQPKELEQELSSQLSILNLIHNQLSNNEVAEPFVNQLLSDVEKNGGDSITMENILPMVYQKIILKLGQIEPISLNTHGPKVVCFIGPTGVGKTTTIAKIASKFKLEMKRKVAMVTADTYRIAAVDQLRTYANILSIPVEVVYKTEEIKETIDKHTNCDLILMDTAGRSHKNTEQCMDLKEMVDAIAASGYEYEIFLLISATTKYKDLMKITEIYADIANYKIIFTKLDETSCLGNILNIRMLTKVPLSYMTCGQNVPDDISDLDVQMIAKQLLGGSE